MACDSNCQWLAQASHFSVREVMHTLTHTHTHTLTHTHAGAILSAKANSDGELHTARKEARRVIHALHKSQEKNDTIEVRSCVTLGTALCAKLKGCSGAPHLGPLSV